MFVIHGVAYAALSAIILLLHAHARSLRVELDINPVEHVVTDVQMVRWVFNAAVGSLSAAIALAIPSGAPPALYSLPGMIYLLLLSGGPPLRGRLCAHLATPPAAR
ncbi:MAG: hypothetical protein WBV61_01790 [Rhodanobacteraceae bacterium]